MDKYLMTIVMTTGRVGRSADTGCFGNWFASY